MGRVTKEVPDTEQHVRLAMRTQDESVSYWDGKDAIRNGKSMERGCGGFWALRGKLESFEHISPKGRI